jgi:NAD(P)-dependent dehydrogenase (short-subunit alcohol dehydrogenase family)
VRCDVTSGEDVEAAFSAVEAELGPVEILVSNAGVTADGLLLSMKEDAWSRVIDANLTGAYRVARRATVEDDPGPPGADHLHLVGGGAHGLARPDQLRGLQGRTDRLRPIAGARDRRARRYRQRRDPRLRHHRHDRGPVRSSPSRDRRAGPAAADGRPRGGGGAVTWLASDAAPATSPAR